jgi:hypothetical protein
MNQSTSAELHATASAKDNKNNSSTASVFQQKDEQAPHAQALHADSPVQDLSEKFKTAASVPLDNKQGILRRKEKP